MMHPPRRRCNAPSGLAKLRFRGASLHPTCQPDTKFLYSGVLKRANKPAIVSSNYHVGLVGDLASAADGMNKRDIIRKQFKAFYFSRQLGAFEDAAKERTMQLGIFAAAAKVDAVKRNII